MNPRALLIGALLASPAWSQEAAPGSFDLRNDAVRDIVHAKAATQYAPIPPSEEEKIQPESVADMDLDEVPLMGELRDVPAQTPRAVLKRNGFLASTVDFLVETAVDSLLGIDSSNDARVSCAPTPDTRASPLQFEKQTLCEQSVTSWLGLGP